MTTIYRIRNKINGKIYIGIDSNYPGRINLHLRGKGNRKIADALKDKYTPDDFEASILTRVSSRKLANWLEEYYVWYYDSINTGYNLRSGGNSWTPTEETKMKMSESAKKRPPETNAKISAAHKGKKHSPEHRAKNSAAKKGKKRTVESINKQIKTRKNNGFRHSPETRAIISKGKEKHDDRRAAHCRRADEAGQLTFLNKKGVKNES